MGTPSFVALLWLAVAPPAEPEVQALSFEVALRSGDRAGDVRGASEAVSIATNGVGAQPKVTSNPIVSAALGARVNPAGAQGFEGIVGISQPLSVRKTALRRRDALRAESRWRAAALDDVRVQRELAIAGAWLELRRAEELRALTVAEVAVEADRVRELERLVNVGERSAAELADASAELERMRLTELDAEGESVDAAHALARALGHGDGAPVRTRGPLPEAVLPAPKERDALLEGVKRLPAIQATELLAAAEEARGTESWASMGPQVSVGLQAQRESLGSTIVQGTVSVPIPTVKRGGRARTAQRASAAALRGQAEDQAVALRAELRTMLHDIEHTEQVAANLQDKVLPSAEQAVGAWERQAAAGEVLPLQVLDARRRLLGVKRRTLEAQIDRAWARVRLAIFAAAMGAAT